MNNSVRSWFLCGCLVAFTLAADESAQPAKLTAKEVIDRWSPRLPSARDYGQMGVSPEESPDVAAYSFRVMGPTLEELWNHYAELCGMTQRYAEKNFQVNGGVGPFGAYVVSDRIPPQGQLGRGLSVFLLKTDRYTVTVTFQVEAGGGAISGSLTAVVPP